MKKIIFAYLIIFSLVSCSGSNEKPNIPANTKENPMKDKQDHVEVLYFHTKERCRTCLAIEKNTKESISSYFTNELKSGRIVFRSIDISEGKNEHIANKYEVTWSSLFLCKWKDGKESIVDMTQFAFENAHSAPDKFKQAIIKKVIELSE